MASVIFDPFSINAAENKVYQVCIAKIAHAQTAGTDSPHPD
jgi:hypothetical protein